MSMTSTHPGAGDQLFTIGKVIGGVFILLRQHFLKIWLAGLLPTAAMILPILYISSLEINRDGTVEFPRELIIIIPTVIIGIIILTMLVFAVITTGTVQAMATGKFELKRAIDLSIRRLLPLIVVAFLSLFGVMIGSILLIIPGIYLILRWWFSSVVAVVEQRGPFASMSRSAELTYDRKWSIVGLFLVSLLITTAASQIFDAILMLLPEMTLAISVALSIVLESVLSGYWAVLPGVAYYYLRIETDGPDTERLAQVFA